MRSASNLQELIEIPSTNCHELIGNRKNQWAIKISANDRMIFEWNQDLRLLNEDGTLNTKLVNEIIITDITDYH